VERKLQRLKQPTATPLCLLYQRVPSSPGIYHLQSSNTYFTGKVASWPPAHRLFDVMVHLHLPTPSNTPDPGPWLHKAPLFGNPFWSTTPYPLEWTLSHEEWAQLAFRLSRAVCVSDVIDHKWRQRAFCQHEEGGVQWEQVC
jgi:hypothetical protein